MTTVRASRLPVSRIAVRLAAIALVALGLSACDINAVPRLDEQAKAAWSQVLNQYQRRADLVPNLVETVAGYARQEQETLKAVTEARAKATQTQLPDQSGGLQGLPGEPGAVERRLEPPAGGVGTLSRSQV